VYLGRTRGTLPEGRARDILQSLVNISGGMRTVLEQAPRVLAIARRYHTSRDMLFLGRSPSSDARD
jgi:glucosamine 6-phosphate synthetase-like amidotransferase/phosphosugar isomerase protein